jgi:hypothetical protein
MTFPPVEPAQTTNFMAKNTYMHLYKAIPALLGASLLLATSGASALSELGNGTLMMELEGGIAYDSNIYTNNLEEGDYIVSARPRLSYVQDGGVINLELGLGIEAGEFLDNTEESFQDRILDFSLTGLDRDGSALAFSLTGGWREQTTASEEIGARIELDIARLDGSAELSLSEKTGIRVSTGYLKTAYANPSYADSKDLSGRVEGLYHYSEKLSLKAGYRYRDIEYSGDYISRSTDTFFVGAEGDLSAKLTGLLELGYVLQEGELDDYFFYSAGLNWQMDEKTTFNLSGLRDNSASPTSDSVINTSLTLTALQSLTEKLTGSAFIGLGRYEREGENSREDDIFRAGIGLSNSLSEASSLDLSLSYEKRDSVSAQSDYERILASVEYSLLF